MKIIKKYTPVKIGNPVGYTNGSRSDYVVGLVFPEFSTICGCNEFDTEEEAIEFAYEKSKYATWSILPVIRFEPEFDN